MYLSLKWSWLPVMKAAVKVARLFAPLGERVERKTGSRGARVEASPGVDYYFWFTRNSPI
ncbi:hypothetical protein [Desulfogranum mediterraneum]|uniref:hypothetical protein n=1 Tax=Desulfogranum mediterraneum TaxID=160661 RepID=UPI001ABFE579|nr:hypothetical protein [Desulfogranum mediterraneum]